MIVGRTSLVGGDAAAMFNDLDQLVVGEGQVNLDKQSPIKQIVVYSGWTVDGITVTYRGADGSPIRVIHGSQKPGNEHVIDLSDSECIASAFGRAGYHEYYHATGINSIGFTIVDRGTKISRTAGPFGNGSASNGGDTFETGPVIALSGHAQNHVMAMAIRGIYFIGLPGGSLGFTPLEHDIQGGLIPL